MVYRYTLDLGNTYLLPRASVVQLACLAGLCSAGECDEPGRWHVFHVLLIAVAFPLLPYAVQR